VGWGDEDANIDGAGMEPLKERGRARKGRAEDGEVEMSWVIGRRGVGLEVAFDEGKRMGREEGCGKGVGVSEDKRGRGEVL